MTAALLAVILFFSTNVEALSAQKAILLDANTNRIIYEKCSTDRSLIASTTKIMTALIVCEQCNVLDRMRIPKEATGIEGSSMYLKEGEVLTIQELLYGLMLQSGNDAAVALAIYCGGTVEGFAELMNDKAKRLEMHDSHFVNPHGLDNPGHYSTAADLARLASFAMKNPIFKQTVSTKTVRVGDRYLRNHNKLLWQFESADGVKTGFTKAAGRILVSSAQQHGRRLVAVTINAPDDWNDHKKLLSDGFAGFKEASLVCKGERLGIVEIEGGTEAAVELLSDADFLYALADDEVVTIALSRSGFAYAPVIQGQNAGYAHVCVDGEPVGKVPLIYGKTIEMDVPRRVSFWERLFGGD